MDPARRRHYRDFYDGAPGTGPVTVVLGNCQAESLRVLLSGSADRSAPAVRIPPVHELTAGDLPPLHRLLARTAVLLSQPVRDDYRDLPVGTRQLAAALPRGARVLRWPVVRHTGLHPYSAIVRHPSDRAAVPPVVAYHDLRTLAVAAGGTGMPDHGPGALREVARLSVAELARRESRDCDVGVSDVLDGVGLRAAHTLNHPGNAVLVTLAHRVQEALGRDADAADPGRELLGGVRAPLEPAVLDALGLDAGAARADWTVDGTPVPDATVRAAQLDWYATHPQWVDAGCHRHADRLALLGLGGKP
ncbi:MAG: hypothetical protein J0I49_33410 [Pseudonocardia sp.]|uniref:WcbI family polysaccharide biosynthesis putative acetyltransferase n=1 Tax=Pseudonocardia sp. TaxID=60912 RepID=UPI001AC40E64|nr:WcbI family polysaccharide biosynthesis putative acetyltransferase [Pseudonocardia sp.]MBN9102956.1 hypothetical protein [Pseudonocardia sp.]